MVFGSELALSGVNGFTQPLPIHMPVPVAQRVATTVGLCLRSN